MKKLKYILIALILVLGFNPSLAHAEFWAKNAAQSLVTNDGSGYANADIHVRNCYIGLGTSSPCGGGGGGGVTSVGLVMPSAFTVTNSPITSSGDLTVTGAGTTAQYIRGNGTLGNSNVFWGISGNAGTSAGTNFIGTTDSADLVFKKSGVKSGIITGNSLYSTGFGFETLLNQSSGISNTAFGYDALKGITTGNQNTAIGVNSLLVNLSGFGNVGVGGGTLSADTAGFNTALGTSSLNRNTTGTNNIGLGYFSGTYNTTGSNQVFINSLDRANYAGEQTGSPIYIQQNATVASQNIFLNGNVQASQLAGSGTRCVQASSTGLLSATSSGCGSSGAPSLTATQIAFGDGSNLMTSFSNFYYDPATENFNVGFAGSGGNYFNIADPATTGQYKLGDLDGVLNGGNLVINDAASLAYYDNTSHTGKFGINTSNPDSAFHVQGTADASNYFRIFDNSNYTGLSLASHDISADQFGIAQISANAEEGIRLNSQSENGLASSSLFVYQNNIQLINSSSSNSLIVSSAGNSFTGNVGINTNTPSAVLDVKSSNSNTHLLIDPNNQFYAIGDIDTGSNGAKFVIDDSIDSGFFTNSGNAVKFGINTFTPTVALDVVGDIQSTSTVDANRSGSNFIGYGFNFNGINTDPFSYSAFSNVFTDTQFDVKYNDVNDNTTSQLFLSINKKGYVRNDFNDFKFGINTATPSVALDVVGDIIAGKDGTYTNGLIRTDLSGGNVLIGDLTAANNGISLLIENSSNILETNLAGIGFGIKFDGSNFDSYFGDYNGVSEGIYIHMKNSTNTMESYSTNKIFYGDGIFQVPTASIELGILSGTGTRAVVADASGVLSAPYAVAGIVASNDLTGQTAANTSVATYTPSADGTYRIGGYVTATAISAGTINLQVTYTDETSTARTQSFSVMGTTSPAITATGAYTFSDIQIRAKSGSAITVKTTFTGVSTTYDVGATIEKLR